MLVVHSKSTKQAVRLKIIGVGNAGCNMLDRYVLGAGVNTDSAALNTDAAHLNACVAEEKVLIGERTTGGLGTGGDPEHALAAWEESSNVALRLLEDADAFLFLGGLGGGTGSVAIARLAAAAREAGKPSFAVLTLPFEFEGTRKARQAKEALESIRESVAAAAIFPNDALHTFPSPAARLAEAFAAADGLLAGFAHALVRMLSSSGPIAITAGDLFGTLVGGRIVGVAYASASGPNRIADVLTGLFKCPLLRGSEPLEKASSVLLHVACSGDLSVSELDAIARGVRRELDNEALLQFGISTDHSVQGEIALTFVATIRSPSQPASIRICPEATETPANPADPRVPNVSAQEASSSLSAPEEKKPHEFPTLFSQEVLDATKGVQPNPEQASDASQTSSYLPSTPAKKLGAKKLPKQEVLPLDGVARGRFEKSEPTIVEGEDLDIPTFIRWKIRIK